MLNSDALMAVAVFGGGATIAWAAAFAWMQWLKHRYDAPAVPGASDQHRLADERVARLEAAVDALAIEMERVGEAQRFTVRLLSERLPASLEG